MWSSRMTWFHVKSFGTVVISSQMWHSDTDTLDMNITVVITDATFWHWHPWHEPHCVVFQGIESLPTSQTCFFQKPLTWTWLLYFRVWIPCPHLRHASSSCACPCTAACRSWLSDFATPSTTVAPSTWTTTCSPAMQRDHWTLTWSWWSSWCSLAVSLLLQGLKPCTLSLCLLMLLSGQC